MLIDFVKTHEPTNEEKQEAQKITDIFDAEYKYMHGNDIELKVIKQDDGFHYYIIKQDEVFDFNELYKLPKYSDMIFSEALLLFMTIKIGQGWTIDDRFYMDKHKGYCVDVEFNPVISQYYLRSITDENRFPGTYYRIQCQESCCKNIFYYNDSDLRRGNTSIACPKCGWFNT